MSEKILLAEDEVNIRKLVARYLTAEGFHVVEAADGNEALRLFEASSDLALAILDVMMPGHDGFELCKMIREHSQLPILMLTARSTEIDELSGFRCGADEYITKPFSPAILVTRVRNLLRRSGAGLSETISMGDIVVLCREHTVLVHQQQVFLTPKEFDLLCYLMHNHSLVLTREQILDRIWGQDYDGDARTVDTHIKCLRAKLGDSGNQIITIRKVGYKFEVSL